MKKIIILLLTCSIVFSCRQSDSTQDNNKVKIDSNKPVLMPNARVSDDSISILKIHYDEYTGSLDFVADSGTVYMTNEIYTSLIQTLQIDSLLSRPVNTIDLCFSDSNDFEKLSPRDGRYMTGSKYNGGWKNFIITGKVSGFNYTKRNYGSSIVILFDMQDFHEIPGTGDYIDTEEKTSH